MLFTLQLLSSQTTVISNWKFWSLGVGDNKNPLYNVTDGGFSDHWGGVSSYCHTLNHHNILLNKETNKMDEKQWKLEQISGTPSHLRASTIAYLCAHQNSKCVPPVFIHRAITCDSFKVLAQKAEEKLCDNQKKGPKILTFYLWWPPDMPPGQMFCTTVFYSSFPLIWYETWLFVQNRFGTLWGHTPLALPPGVTSKFWICSSGLLPVKVSRF